jgi:hypothetical protein
VNPPGALASVEAVVDLAGVAEHLEARMPTGGRPRQLSVRTLLVGILAALADDRPAQLTRVHAALAGMDAADRARLGIDTPTRRGVHRLTYRQVERTFHTMISLIDPTPVPSFARVEPTARAAHLAAARADVDVAGCGAGLTRFCDQLLEASIPEAHKNTSTSAAVDWTDHATWSRPSPAGSDQPPADPDASWGHRAGNTPGTRTEMFFGYYAQAVTTIADEGSPAVPELVRRVSMNAPTVDPAATMVGMLAGMAAAGIAVGDVLADSGYAYRNPTTWAAPLRALGVRLVQDLHPNDRGPKGTYDGAVCANGNLFCPCTPVGLLTLGPLGRGASPTQLDTHHTQCAEAARYKLGRISTDDNDGYHRVQCPAAAGKLRCPLKPASMLLSFEHPEILAPPEHPPRCCAYDTITVPPTVNAKTRQKHDYPSARFTTSFNRRTGVERSFSGVKDPSGIDLRRGSCRLLGRTPNLIMFSCAMVVHNLRQLASFARRPVNNQPAPAALRVRRRP